MSSFTRLGGLLAISAGLFSGQVLVADSFVANPSFEDNFSEEWPHYGEIDQWNGGSGTNLVEGPFHNGATPIPDGSQVGFKQGSGELSQDIFGLEDGTRYVVQFFYDARNCCGGTIDLAVLINGEEIKRIINVTPQGENYKFGWAAFTSSGDTATLAFNAEAQGDATVNLDAVSIVAREAGTIPVPNSSFEASGAPLEAEQGDEVTVSIAGWVADGSVAVVAGSANNGATPDQDLVAGLSGASSISTTIEGLVEGESYDLSVAYNAVADAKIDVSIDGNSAFTEDVTAVGGDNPYKTAKATFTAGGATADVEFAQTNESGTLLLDNIKLAGAVAETFPPLALDPSEAIVKIGQTAQINVTMAEGRQSKPNPIVVLRSTNPEIAAIVDAEADGTIALDFSDVAAGAVRSFEVEGLVRGRAPLEVVDSAGLDLANSVAINVSASLVVNASFEAGALPGGVGYGAIPGWSGGSGINDETQPFLDNGTIPDRTRVAFLQGAATMTQEIAGLNPAKNYWLQFYYNTRDCCGGTINLSASFAGQELALIENVEAVGDFEPFHFINIPFQPSAADGELSFTTTVEGDATALLDAVTIVQRNVDEVFVRNPSFEVSLPIQGVGYQGPGLLAGWEITGGHGVNVDGAGPFTDNGLAGAQDAVLFLQNAATASQRITGLTPGDGYSLTYLVNRRNCCAAGEPNAYEVLIDDEIVFNEELDPAGGQEPYFERSVEFTAGAGEVVIAFRNVPNGDQTLLVDDVRIKIATTNPSGLIARYALDETEGIIMNDVSGLDRDGTFENEPSFGQAAIVGGGTSIGFADGSFGTVGSRSLPFSSLTVATWANLTALGDRQTIFGQGDRNGEPAYAVIASGANLEFFIGATPTYLAENAITAGTNHHITMTYDRGETAAIAVYVDGVAVISESGVEPLPLSNDTDFFVAAFFGALSMGGLLDDVQLYNRAITAEEVAFLQANPGDALDPGAGNGGGGEAPAITGLSKTAEGVALQLPEGTTYDIEYSADLVTWDTIATEVTGSYVDADAARIGAATGYYRGVVK